jgi:ribosomal subunit interface protein
MKQSNIIISGLNFEVSSSFKDHIYKKCQKLMKHNKQIDFFRFELERDMHSSSHSLEYIAKGRMRSRGKLTCLSAKSDNMYKSIDLLSDKLDRSLRKNSRIHKFKRKIKSFFNKSFS